MFKRQVSRRLPGIVDEEPVAPPADVTLDLIRRRDHRARQPEHEVGDRVAADVAGEVEEPARVVRRAPAGRHPPQVEAGADVVRSAVVGEHVRQLERRVELEPVRPARPEPVEVADVDAGKAGIVERRVAVEPGNSQRRSGVRWSADIEGIHGIEVDAVIADPEVVEQVRPQRVRVRKQPVLVDARLRDRRHGDDRVADVRVEAVVPVVADVQPNLVAEILIDPGQDLVDVVGVGARRLQVVGGASPVRLGVVLQELARGRRDHRARG